MGLPKRGPGVRVACGGFGSQGLGRGSGTFFWSFSWGKVTIFLVAQLQSSSFAGAEQLLNNAARTFEWLTSSPRFLEAFNQPQVQHLACLLDLLNVFMF